MPFPEQWLHSAIERATDVKAWPVDVTDQDDLPWIVYRRAATEREHYLTYPAGSPLATFDITIYAATYLQTKQLAALVRLECDNFTGDHAGVTIQETSLTEERDGDMVELGGENKPVYVAELSLLVRFAE